MKNFGIKTKKFVRKITAIASATLMAGLSMGVAAADLSSLTSTFITNGNFDAYVAVGTGGSSNVVGFAKDVAGSVVLAAAFAQKATTTSTTSGSAVLTRNLTTGYINGSTSLVESFILNNDKSMAKSWVNADTGFSWLPNTTVTNSSDDAIANVTAVLSVSSDGIRTNNLGNVKLYPNAITYNLTFNSDQGTSGNKGLTNKTKLIPFPDGKKYQLTSFSIDNSSALATGTDAINATFGDFETISASLNEVKSIGSTGATFKVTDASTDSKLKIVVTGSDGTELFNDWVAADSEIYSNDDFTLNLASFSVSALDSSVSANIDWTTSSLTLRNNEENDKWANWTIQMTGGNATGAEANITSIAWVYKVPSSVSYISVPHSSTTALLDSLFNLTVSDLTINSTDKKETTLTVKALNSEEELSFIDENGTAIKFDFSPHEGLAVDSQDYQTEFDWYIGNSTTPIGYTITCNNGSPTNFNLSRSGDVMQDLTNGTYFYLNRTSNISIPYNISAIAYAYGNTSAGCTGMKYNVTVVNMTTSGGVAVQHNITWTGSNGTSAGDTPSMTDYTDGTFTISESGSRETKISFDNGTIDSIDYYESGSAYESNILTTVGDYFYTKYGVKLLRDSTSQLTINYPEAQRIVKVSLGQEGIKEYNLTSGSYDEDLDVTLKSSSGSSVSVNPISVGLAKLDSEITSSTLDKPIILLGGPAVNSLVKELVDESKLNLSGLAADKAVVSLIDDAFNSQSALVIAGYAGDDTRMAAQVVASNVLGSSAVSLTGSNAILNTGVDSYTEVTVV